MVTTTAGLEPVIYSIQRAAIVISVGVIAITVPILCVVYYHQRHHPILKARRMEWSLVSQILVMFASIAYGYDGWSHYPTCAQILFTNSVVAMLVFDSHIIRCWLLLYSWNVCKALCEFRAGDVASGRNWWLRHTYLASGKMMTLVMISLTLMHLACWQFLIYLNGWELSWTRPAHAAICTRSPLLWFFGVWGALALLMTIAIYIVYNMRLVVDAFQIKNELMTIGGIWLIGPMPFWLLALLFPSLERRRCYIIMTALMVPLCAMRVFYLSLVKPLIMIQSEHQQRAGSYEELVSDAPTSGEIEQSVHETTTRARKSTITKPVDLRRMLDTNSHIVDVFVDFLTKEFSVENWRFYSEVLQLRAMYGGWTERDAGRSGLETGHFHWFNVPEASSANLQQTINRIYNMYLARSAPFEVNLSSERLREIRQCFGVDHLLRPESINDIPERLCRAQDEIYDLMRSDSYERFKKSPDFNKILPLITA